MVPIALGLALALHWIPGDLHSHVAPPDDRDVTLDVAGIAHLARENGLAFVVLTPHLWPGAWRDAGARRRFQAAHAKMARAARAVAEVTLIPGIEFGVRGVGHFGVVGVDPAALSGPDFLQAARAAAAFMVVNHPFALPTRIPGIAASHWDMSYRPWTRRSRGFAEFDGVEIWNVPLAMANVVSRPGGKTGEDRALAEADARARARRRKVTLVGGSDNHGSWLPATTWVLAEDAAEASVLEALRAGRTCVGGPEAGSLEARADGAGDWVGIGGVVRAEKSVELRWTGRGRVFVDGVDRGVEDGGHVEAIGDGEAHTFRIVVGRSRSGFVYANLFR